MSCSWSSYREHSSIIHKLSYVCKMSFRAMHDYSMGTSKKHAKSRTGHNVDIYGTWHGRVQCIRFRAVYHRRATVELALTCVINNFNTTLNNHLSIHTNVKQTILLYC